MSYNYELNNTERNVNFNDELEDCIWMTNNKTSNNTTAEYDIEDEENILFYFITYGILLNTIGIFGIFGNIISMIILSRPQMKSSINYLLIGLARCDTVLIITSVLLFGLPAIYTKTGFLFTYNFYIYPLIAPIVYPIGMISQTVSVYLTLTVTLERFVAVCHPLRARSLCTCGRARFYVILIIIFSVIYNITRFLEVVVKQCMHSKFNQPVYLVHPTQLRYNQLYISIYIHWMYLIFMYFIPFSCLAVLNTAIYRQVRIANQERQRLSRLQKKEIGLATMLLCVVVVFLICNLGALVSNVLEAFYGISIDSLVEIGNFMITINSSVNFVIYVIFGEKFKRLFIKLFFPHGIRICGTSIVGRESPDQTMFDESIISWNGNSSRRPSGRIYRTSTGFVRNGRVVSNPRGKKAYSARVPGSTPAYYTRRESHLSSDFTSTTNF